MSWSISKTLDYEHSDIGRQRVCAELDAMDRASVGNQHCILERDEQIDAAIQATSQLLAVGGFSNAAEISVSLSGHANPDHKAEAGWSNDAVTISVSIKRYRAH